MILSKSFSDFFKKESAPGIILMFVAVLAILIANSPLSHYYDLLLSTIVEIRVGEFRISKPLLLWINDGLMTMFFFLIGLELKREVIEGELSEIKNVILPAIGAFGGMLVPSAIYVLINIENEVAVQGWAIPAATDIAFSLGILALLGSKVPLSLKVFLTSLAVFDDIGAIFIIAVFYTPNISNLALSVAVLCIAILFVLNRLGVVSKVAYIIVGTVMWVGMLKSGVHATLSGVVLAMFIPIRTQSPNTSPLKEFEHDLYKVVTFFILPLFAFANAGINLHGISVQQVFHSVPLGIAAGLFFGKQIGVFGFCWLGIKLNLITLPRGMTLKNLYGISALCGVGFTMSLFIGSLAFEETGVNLLFDERLGILIGSFISGITGYCILKLSLK